MRGRRTWVRAAAPWGVALFLLGSIGAAADGGKIVRPTDRAALPAGEADVIATAPAGKLELDGKPVPAGEPFPNVFHATIKPEPGEHTLALAWDGGRQEVRFFVGDNLPAGFKRFVRHPPQAGVACTQCHGLSTRGRFRFKGGCFDCHQQEAFAGIHFHPVHILQECGICHSAHGSTVKAHLTMPKELACKQCHN